MLKISNLSDGEKKLFAKYYGQGDLVRSDEFWVDVRRYLYDYNVVLPIEYLPEKIRILQEMIDCQPGACGECCRYGLTPIYQYDIHRIVSKGIKTTEDLQNCIYTRKDKTMYMRGDPPGASCPLLDNNSCTIYNVRPDVCWLFPVQQGPHMSGNTGLVRYRLKCQPAVDVARKIFTGALSDGRHILLPNLTLISKEDNNGTDTKPDQ